VQILKMSMVSLVAVLSACGGGGDIEDGSQPLSVSATSVEVTGPSAGICASGTGPIIYVYGGVWPYTLRNPYPEGLVLGTQRIEGPGQGTRLSFTGACFTTLALLIIDQSGKSISVSVTNRPGQ
jgi:hypothetical protein